MTPSALAPATEPVPLEIRRILVPTDLTEGGRAALDIGLALAAGFDASVVLLHASFAASLETTPLVVMAYAELREAREACLASAVAAARARYPRTEGLFLDDAPAPGILAGIERTGADLVVMPTHARQGLSRFVLGSVTEQIIRHAPVPVLAVPSVPGSTRFPHILVATDFSQAAKPAVRLAVGLAEQLGAELTLVHAHDATVCRHPEDADQALSAARQEADALRHSFAAARGKGSSSENPVGSLLVEGDACEGILEAAVRSKAELIVIGTHGRTGLGRLVLGSVAEQVLRRAGIAVLTVSPRAHALG